MRVAHLRARWYTRRFLVLGECYVIGYNLREVVLFRVATEKDVGLT